MVTYSKRISVSDKTITSDVSEINDNEPVDILIKKLENIFGSWISTKKRLIRIASYILKCN
ncbi:unnamed protein product [Brugia pahangi]|uniref:Transposase n=1 Tax=Brugia pahangi TaxID=6280 RepID=A0A0N4TFB7_BRUPA|nr:unnamed protein product [Brugia pahangi]